MSVLLLATLLTLAVPPARDAPIPAQDAPTTATPPRAADPASPPVPAAPATPDPPAPVVPPPAALALPADEIVVRARLHPPPEDPLEQINMKTFEVMQKVDDTVVAPAAHVYDSMPEPVRNGLHNFLKNLNEPVVFLNFMLQHKIGKAAETVGRFTLNSVAGVGGLFDIARRRPFHLPRRPNGFGDTLGFYGVRQGAFLYLPLIGPTTVRDLIGLVADRLVLPTAVGSPFDRPLYTIPAGVIGVLDHRSGFDDELREIRATTNPYAARRDTYLCRRQAEIDALHVHHHRGQPDLSVPRRCDIP